MQMKKKKKKRNGVGKEAKNQAGNEARNKAVIGGRETTQAENGVGLIHEEKKNK